MDFIFENPIIIIVIIGMITSFLKKMKQSNQADPKKEPEWKKVMKIPPTLNKDRPEITISNSKQQPNNNKVAQEYYAIKESTGRNPLNTQGSQKEQTTSRKSFYSNRIENVKVDTAKREFDEQIDFSPSKENVIEGIVWSEILGPPRAFKSHSSKRLTSRR